MRRHFAGTRTTFLGFLRGRQLAAAYASADFFVFPSESETLGNVVGEVRRKRRKKRERRCCAGPRGRLWSRGAGRRLLQRPTAGASRLTLCPPAALPCPDSPRRWLQGCPWWRRRRAACPAWWRARGRPASCSRPATPRPRRPPSGGWRRAPTPGGGLRGACGQRAVVTGKPARHGAAGGKSQHTVEGQLPPSLRQACSHSERRLVSLLAAGGACRRLRGRRWSAGPGAMPPQRYSRTTTRLLWLPPRGCAPRRPRHDRRVSFLPASVCTLRLCNSAVPHFCGTPVGCPFLFPSTF